MQRSDFGEVLKVGGDEEEARWQQNGDENGRREWDGRNWSRRD